MGDCITILVTGATGRIGKYLVNALLEKGEKVRVLIRKRMTEFENVETFYGDLLDKEAVKKAVEGIDTIFHLAAVVDYSAPEDLMFKVNVLGTRNLLENFKGSKFIYLSSAAVLGKKLKEFPADENTSYNPSNFYGRTKMKAEKLVKEKNGIIVRSTDVYGPGFEEGYYYVFNGLENGNMPIFGRGKNIIQYIHVNDLIRALLLTLEKGKPGEIYTVAGKDMKSQRELYEIICKYLEVPFVEKYKSVGFAKLSLKLRKKTGFLPEHIDKLSSSRTFNLTKAKNELGFEPKVDYEEGISEMVKNYKKSKEEEENITEEQSEQQS